MQNNVTSQPVEKYAVPRNNGIEETSLAEVLASDPLAKDKDGTIEGSRMPLFDGGGAPNPKSALLRPGLMFSFKLGWLYVFDERQTEAQWLFQAAKMAALFVLPTVAESTGEMSHLVEEIGNKLLLGETGESGSGQKSEGAGVSWNAYLKMLNERGVVFLPGVNLVGAEHQVDPPKLFSRERHRLIMTYERPDGEQKIYSMSFDSPHARQIVTGMIAMLFEARWWGEFSYLTDKVKLEQIDDIEAIGDAVAKEYRARYGDKVADHISDIYADYQKACDAELERKGFTSSKAGQVMLERLAPMVPYYEQVPALKQGLSALRGMAGL